MSNIPKCIHRVIMRLFPLVRDISLVYSLIHLLIFFMFASLGLEWYHNRDSGDKSTKNVDKINQLKELNEKSKIPPWSLNIILYL